MEIQLFLFIFLCCVLCNTCQDGEICCITDTTLLLQNLQHAVFHAVILNKHIQHPFLKSSQKIRFLLFPFLTLHYETLQTVIKFA